MSKNLPSISTSSAPVVHAKDGRVYANSRDVAAYFGKRHSDVLPTIEQLRKNSELMNDFIPVQLQVKVGRGAMRSFPTFDMTRAGFVLLAMRFTGAKALQFQIAYIRAFDAMEERLRNIPTKPALPDFTNPSEAARAWADQFDQKLVAQEEVKRLAPLALVGERAVSCKGHTLTECARTFPGVNIMKVHETLLKMGYLYRSSLNKGYRVKAAYRDRLFGEKLHEATGARTIIATPKGKVELEKLYRSGNLPMKKGCSPMSLHS